VSVITNTAGARITPLLVLGYETTRQSQSIFHDIIGGGQDVTLRPASLRSGTLRLLFATEDDAVAAETAHAAGKVLRLADADRPSVTMSYVLDGALTRRLDDGTRKLWTLDVAYQEVAA
jgi:hypothetical protein